MNASASMAQQRHADSPGRSRENSLASGHIRNRTVHANGLDFPILEAGHGPLVLCLHGFPDHAQSWIPFLDRLEREGYWAVAPALRGYWVGGAAPDGSYRALATGQDVLALIESLGAEQAVLVGHDLGARAAYAAASLHAGRVRKLVGLAVPYGKGLASAFVADGDQQRRSWYMFFFQTRLAEIAVQLNDFAFLDRLWREWSPGYVLPAPARSSLNEAFAQPGVLTQTLAYYRQLFAPPSDAAAQALEALATGPITVPSLYLHGADDGCISAQLSEGMEAAFTNGLERVVMPEVGHFLHLEQPDAVFDHILRFIRT
ncbi:MULTISPECIES: alpha/beta hydrolase [unclassified Bradyrhizobium]|uniref:alpha/beta fold hydrolase n=1 Tax=unclassified Bradyrhizobium TaxID=2631580 RepID=UPI001FF9F744|nr:MULTISPECIES: alpha/beta hydrolase [unclassified Bradyrhizobium]MCK1319652.1 alpha/beta hydrolase [Bradyrhizobium sp. 156]MCK1566656.1 alpha/beta hydrolase [Bradyrhizobium sp. 173]UPJ96317.1 alpha/beta hydrolase [Bradyrhizobium sp. 172]